MGSGAKAIFVIVILALSIILIPYVMPVYAQKGSSKLPKDGVYKDYEVRTNPDGSKTVVIPLIHKVQFDGSWVNSLVTQKLEGDTVIEAEVNTALVRVKAVMDQVSFLPSDSDSNPVVDQWIVTRGTSVLEPTNTKIKVLCGIPVTAVKQQCAVFPRIKIVQDLPDGKIRKEYTINPRYGAKIDLTVYSKSGSSDDILDVKQIWEVPSENVKFPTTGELPKEITEEPTVFEIEKYKEQLREIHFISKDKVDIIVDNSRDRFDELTSMEVSRTDGITTAKFDYEDSVPSDPADIVRATAIDPTVRTITPPSNDFYIAKSISTGDNCSTAAATGWSKNEVADTTRVQVPVGTGAGSCQRSAFEFNIPSDIAALAPADITNVDFRYYLHAKQNPTTCRYTEIMTSDNSRPSTWPSSSYSNVWSEIYDDADSVYYGETGTEGCQATGAGWKQMRLGTAGLDDFRGQLDETDKWFGVGVLYISEARPVSPALTRIDTMRAGSYAEDAQLLVTVP